MNLFFFECCCDNRHFQIYVEEELLAEDVHRAAYADALGDVGDVDTQLADAGGQLGQDEGAVAPDGGHNGMFFVDGD